MSDEPSLVDLLDLSDLGDDFARNDAYAPAWADKLRVATYGVLARQWPKMKLESLFFVFGHKGENRNGNAWPLIVTVEWHWRRPTMVVQTVAELNKEIGATGLEATAAKLARSFTHKVRVQP